MYDYVLWVITIDQSVLFAVMSLNRKKMSLVWAKGIFELFNKFKTLVQSIAGQKIMYKNAGKSS